MNQEQPDSSSAGTVLGKKKSKEDKKQKKKEKKEKKVKKEKEKKEKRKDKDGAPGLLKKSSGPYSEDGEFQRNRVLTKIPET